MTNLYMWVTVTFYNIVVMIRSDWVQREMENWRFAVRWSKQ